MSSQKLSIGLGVLSWRGYHSLHATLASYRDENLFSLFDQSLVFLPEMEDAGRAIAAEFGIEHAGHANNLGILGGFEALAAAMTTDYILLCENDFALIETHAQAHAQLDRAIASLESQDTTVWRFRHRVQPGDVFSVHKANRYWPAQAATQTACILACMRRVLRPAKARKFIGYSTFYKNDCDLQHPDVVKKTTDGDYMVRSDAMPWSNNPFLINRRYFLDVIIPAARANPTTRTINGFPTIETELNRGWWAKQKLWAGIANPGLFTHARKGDRGY
jgi:hypothetical protein